MKGKYESPGKQGGFLWVVLVLAAAIAVGVLFLGNGEKEAMEETMPTFTPPTETAAAVQSLPETTEDPNAVIARATVAAQGDLLMHATFFQKKYNPVCRTGEGEYDFSSIFRYVSGYVKAADYAAVNLETTLGGDGFPYQGNPTFNCPDAILEAAKEAGYDLLLTANNHSYDTLMTGINRTVEKTKEAGLDTLGTRLSQVEERFLVKEINGISIGMVCYTYTMTMSGGKPRLNDNAPVEKPEQINYFSYSNLEKFYTEAEELLAAMKLQGAEATMFYIHWGTEYETTENKTQKQMAQKLCDLGYDVIVGGHPHVVQPVELLESSVDAGHKTVCIYSLGNAVSNQRRELMRLKTGHTEDGAMFTVTFEKTADGAVRVADCNVLPTWVHLYENAEGKKEYNILPLDGQMQEQWQTLFDLDGDTVQKLRNSYDRTMEIVGEGLEQCRESLSEN